MDRVIYLAVLNAVCALVKNYLPLCLIFFSFFFSLLIFLLILLSYITTITWCSPCTCFSSSLMIFLLYICLTVTWLPCLLGCVVEPSGLPLFCASLSVSCLMVAVSKVQTQWCHCRLWWLLLILAD